MAFPDFDPVQVFRDFVTDKVPSSGKWNPRKPEIRRLLKSYESAILALIAGQGGDIELARGVISFAVTGGTANDIIAEPDSELPDNPGSAVYTLGGVEQSNTGNVTINGKPLLTNSGNQIAPGGLVADGIYLFLDDGTSYRLVSDQASAAIVAAAEAAAAEAAGYMDAAEESADRAEGYASMLSADRIRFKTVQLMLSDAVMSYTPGAGLIEVGAGDVVEAEGFRYEVASSGTSDHHVETAGGVKLYVLPTEVGYDPRALGAQPVGDVSTIIQYMLPLGPVIVAAGDWRCDSMITIEANQSLTLMPGAKLRRYSANSASTDPVVWLRGSNAKIAGAGKRVSGIYTQNRAPKGVVRIGHEDMAHSHATVTFCTLRGVEIGGSIVNGQTSGHPDICVFIPNAQIGGINANYYHTLDDILLSSANFGINLRGWANSNLITDIHGRQLGNATLGDGGLFWLQGSLDNTIVGMQFHASPGQAAIILDDYDNTGVSGGVRHQNQYNSFVGVVCEQGGAGAVGVKSYASRTTYIGIRDNVQGGNILHSTWNAQGNTLENIGRSFGVKTGSGWTRTYQAEGTFSVRVGMGATLTGAVVRSGVLVVRFHGADNSGANPRSAEYRIPITGTSTYSIGTPVKIWGDDLTITQIDNSASHVTLTVAGASTINRSSLHVEVQAYGGAALD